MRARRSSGMLLTLPVITLLFMAAAPKLSATAPASGPAVRAAGITTDAEALAKDYKADPKAADAKYKGKYLEVSGVVHYPGMVSAGTALSPDPNFFQVAESVNTSPIMGGLVLRCFVTPADSMRCNLLTQGQTITIRGTCNGIGKDDMKMDNLELKDVSIVKTGPDPAPVLAAEALAPEFVKDQQAAIDKYGGSKVLIVTGTVQKFVDDSHAIWLDGGKSADGKPLAVQATVSSVIWEDVRKKYAVGKPIAIKGEVASFKDDHLNLVFGLVMP